ncbi:MAG: NAD/NADP octopine/nopaline dehydrogenase family protein, partial [Flavobacterium sp.]|nr:NAD/NADP octopine/nopaline dehydrogenase family protein [Flavobacterium sp.]
FASPYLWKKLGDRYPIVCFSTSPYSSKIIKEGTVYIKRRKRTWLASLEGNFDPGQVLQLGRLFPQAAHCRIPALTSLNNIGAVFHPAAYLLNMEAIEQAAKDNNPFSFYMEGIFYNSEVASTLEQIDQVRLQIAQRLGMNVFGLAENPREDVWRKLITGMRALEEEHEDEILELREIRKLFIKFLNNSVLSAQHWLDITYGVTRVQGESLGSAIGRTPTYQNMSVPQIRYMEEDIPTGLVPLEAIAIRLGIDASPLTTIIDKYNNIQGGEARASGRGLREFSSDFIRDYLLGS